MRTKKSKELTGLRRRPEKEHRKKTKKPKGALKEDTQRLLQELERHQVEMETQNEELRRARDELEQSRARDVTDRKLNEMTIEQASKTLEQERNLLQTVMDEAKNLHLVYLDRDFNFVRVNKTYAKACGYRPEEMVGKNHFALYPHAENEAIFARVRDTGEGVEYHDKPFEYPDHPERGVTYWDWTLTPMKNDAGTVVGFVFSLFETTQRKRVEKALRHAQEQLHEHAIKLEAVVQERTERLQRTVGELEHFSYTITHDMRAPLRAMQGFGDILLSECNVCIDPVRRDYIRRIITAAGRMDSLITDALNYSKAMLQEMELEPVDAKALLDGIVESYPQFHSPKAEVKIEEGIPRVLGNKAALTQCFSNLLENAVKFVPAGRTPKVRVWAEKGEPSQHRDPSSEYVRIWVEDNGIGIAQEHQKLIWEMFQKLDKAYEGTGVGLALVRKVVERMKGKTDVISKKGKGSRFWVELKRVGVE